IPRGEAHHPVGGGQHRRGQARGDALFHGFAPNTLVFLCPSLLATMQVTTASPVPVPAARTMPRSRARPTITTIPPTGRFTCFRTMANVISPTPGTPAVPTDARVAVRITMR